jgi:hypothetical protein
MPMQYTNLWGLGIRMLRALQRSGAVTMEGVEDVVLDQNQFTRVDGNGVFLGGYTRRVNITRNDFNWIGDSAMAAFGWTSDCLNVRTCAKTGTRRQREAGRKAERGGEGGRDGESKGEGREAASSSQRVVRLQCSVSGWRGCAMDVWCLCWWRAFTHLHSHSRTCAFSGVVRAPVQCACLGHARVFVSGCCA